MVDLNGHEAGNGGYSQGKPTAYRDSSTRRDCPLSTSLVKTRHDRSASTKPWLHDHVIHAEGIYLFSSRDQFKTTCKDADPFWSADFIIRKRRPSVS